MNGNSGTKSTTTATTNLDSNLIRPVVSTDQTDIAELARHTYSGHDWILTELNNWIASPHSLPLAIEIDNHVRALENICLVDSGRTGWLEGLRVHPSFRRRGLAGTLQRRIIEEGGRAFKGMERIRYATHGKNWASIRLAERCGLVEVWRWGLGASSEEKGEPDDYPAFLDLGLSPALYGTKLRVELERVEMEGGANHNNPPTGPCTVADVLQLESHLRSSASTVGILCDWKVQQLTPSSLAQLFDDGVTGVSLTGDRRGYSLGRTRDNFGGSVRLFHVVTSTKDAVEVRYGDFLRLAIHECRVAVEDGVTSVMFFFELELRPFLVKRGLVGGEDDCVLMSGTVSGA